MTPDLFWIVGPWRGRLAIAARPRGGDWLEDEITGWRLAGIDIVVSLLESHEADVYKRQAWICLRFTVFMDGVMGVERRRITR